ncbi:hypothetical protein F5Y13DRAFT_157783 [Hypoxylon sp. FL1857]|nr:hypothetical protein F5Y13DRAFT_157783 [Hypoxylon sp. FL1857]
MPETLREKANRKIHGPNANPSQLGDPISLKAEQSDYVPTEEERGAAETSQFSSNDTDDGRIKNEGLKKGDNETLREKAAKKLHGPEANPSQLGDPISLKAETTDDVPADREKGARRKRDSRL